MWGIIKKIFYPFNMLITKLYKGRGSKNERGTKNYK